VIHATSEDQLLTLQGQNFSKCEEVGLKVHAENIPNYSQTMSPLQELMETVYKAKGKRTRRAIANYDITDLWGGDAEAAFKTIQLQLANTVRLAHPRDGHTMCQFTDQGILTGQACLHKYPTTR
jgi:hypothetical protein